MNLFQPAARLFQIGHGAGPFEDRQRLGQIEPGRVGITLLVTNGSAQDDCPPQFHGVSPVDMKSDRSLGEIEGFGYFARSGLHSAQDAQRPNLLSQGAGVLSLLEMLLSDLLGFLPPSQTEGGFP